MQSSRLMSAIGGKADMAKTAAMSPNAQSRHPPPAGPSFHFGSINDAI
jgi:hypothetical protein